MTPLAPDFKEFLRLLNESPIRYLVVGGYAVAWHGYPRGTGDLDVWVAQDRETAEKLSSVLQQFGFGGSGFDTDRFLNESSILRLGVEPVRIEIMNSISGGQFDSCYARRSTAEIDQIKIHFIALDDLIKNKKASGRPMDLADVDHLEQMREGG